MKFSFLTYVCVKNSGRGAKNCVHDHMLPDFLVSYSAPANTPLANRIFQPINTKRILTTEIRCNRHPYSLFPSLAGPRIMGPRTRMHDRSCGIDNSACLHSYICGQVDCGTFGFGGKTPVFNKIFVGKINVKFSFCREIFMSLSLVPRSQHLLSKERLVHILLTIAKLKH